MKNKINIKSLILWIFIWLFMLSTLWVFASVTWAWTIWSLFKKIWTVYKLMWDEIEDNTVDSSEIEDNTLTSADLAANSVSNSELAPNSVYSNNILNKTIQKEDIADWVIPEKTSQLVNDSWFITSETDPLSLKISWDTIKTDWYLKIWNSTSSFHRRRNMIKIWDWDYIKIWEWQEDDELSIYARKWVNILGWWLYVNWKKVPDSLVSVSVWGNLENRNLVKSLATCPSWYTLTWCWAWLNWGTAWKKDVHINSIYRYKFDTCAAEKYSYKSRRSIRAQAICTKIN
jgi:hypothetical protein